jgi:tetratricopeptide (TPR) repeat protein
MVAVFFWLPNWVEPPTAGSVAVTTSPGTPARVSAQEQASPWSDAQLAKQRKAAQAVLELLLEQQFTLEEMSVEQWAAAEFAAATQLATSGDELYRQQQFEAAQANYQSGLESMTALVEAAPAVFERQLQAGLAALAANQPQPATAALTIALLIKPDSETALTAQARALTLPEVLTLIKQAQQAQRDNELEQAAATTAQALGLDPAHELATSLQLQLQQEIARRDFNRAMTAGYQAMDRQDYDSAEARFLAAQRLLPAAAETGAALAQARSARTLQRIESLRGNADAAQRNEDWNAAVAAFDAILRIDDTVQFAREGAARSRERQSLDQRLQQTLEKPERLADQRIYAETRQLLTYAITLSPAGPRLRRQLSALDTLLQQALVPIAVLLQSDEQTDVTVYRVAHLGTFRRQQLELKPGTYTAVGVRTGFRDVRQQFTLSHDQSAPVITIACTDPI